MSEGQSAALAVWLALFAVASFSDGAWREGAVCTATVCIISLYWSVHHFRKAFRKERP